MRREANSCPLQKNSHFLTPLSFLRQTAQNNPRVFCGYEAARGGGARKQVVVVGGWAEKCEEEEGERRGMRRRRRTPHLVDYKDCLWALENNQMWEWGVETDTFALAEGRRCLSVRRDADQLAAGSLGAGVIGIVVKTKQKRNDETFSFSLCCCCCYCSFSNRP